jgi:hypothetical protein
MNGLSVNNFQKKGTRYFACTGIALIFFCSVGYSQIDFIPGYFPVDSLNSKMFVTDGGFSGGPDTIHFIFSNGQKIDAIRVGRTDSSSTLAELNGEMYRISFLKKHMDVRWFEFPEYKNDTLTVLYTFTKNDKKLTGIQGTYMVGRLYKDEFEGLRIYPPRVRRGVVVVLQMAISALGLSLFVWGLHALLVRNN